MASINLSPTASNKFKNRESANKIRHRSPKLQQILRERCRRRMREKRGQLFNSSRIGLDNIQDTLTEIVREEFSNLATKDSINSLSFIIDEPLEPEEALKIENEILTEEEQWILEEYEKMSREEMDLLIMVADGTINDVVCPICQKSSLTQKINSITCQNCILVFNTVISVEELGWLISESVNTHSENCVRTPGFVLLPENNNMQLYISCQSCAVFERII